MSSLRAGRDDVRFASTDSPSLAWQPGFLELLPAIQRLARFAFRDLDPASREEAVAEAVAAAAVAYRRLVELGRRRDAFASPLARYAVLHVRNGRHIGGRQDHVDVLSRVAQRRHGFQVTSLEATHQPDRSPAHASRGKWLDTLVAEDRRATPADVAVTRIDFRSWLATLSCRQCRVAEALAAGDTTQDAARRFQVTPGRISQMRRELAEAWSRHQGDAGAVA
jgi:hypothetical protein